MPDFDALPNIVSNFRLDGKLAVITGAAGILGARHAVHFAAAGAVVVVADKENDACDNVVRQITKNGGVAHSLPVDLSSEPDVTVWASEIIRRFGPPDILMNNAACKSPNFFAPLENFLLRDWNEVMAVNVTAVFLASKLLGTFMAAAGRGSIINVSSIYGILGPDHRIYEGSHYSAMGGKINSPLVYSASKGAVIAITKYLATLWGPMGVRTNSLVPGGVGSGQNSIFSQKYSARVPLSRMGRPDEIALAALFLASDASSYINGQDIIVDGGLSAW